MKDPRKGRQRPARIAATVGLMALVASAAWADDDLVDPPISPSQHQFLLKQRITVSSLPRGVRRETSRLRVGLIKQKREDARLARQRKAVVRQFEPEVTVAPDPPAEQAQPVASGSTQADWYATAMCESGGVWSINSGNGYWGGLQFAPSTWFGYGGGPFDGEGPFPYSAAEQIAVAERVLASQGAGAWPNCFVPA